MDPRVPRDFFKKVEEDKVIDYADLLCGPGGLCPVKTQEGTRWIARCPIRPHDTRMKTFWVDEEADMWSCSECWRRGGVIDLVKAVTRCDADQAAAELLASIPFLKGA